MTCPCLWISAVMVNEQICIRFPNEKHHITLLENRLIFGKFTQYTMLVYILCFMLPKKKKNRMKNLQGTAVYLCRTGPQCKNKN